MRIALALVLVAACGSKSKPADQPATPAPKHTVDPPLGGWSGGPNEPPPTTRTTVDPPLGGWHTGAQPITTTGPVAPPTPSTGTAGGGSTPSTAKAGGGATTTTKAGAGAPTTVNGAGAGTGTVAGAGTSTNAGKGPSAGTGAAAGSAPGTGSGSGAGKGPVAGSNGAGSGAGSAAGPGPGAAAGAGSPPAPTLAPPPPPAGPPPVLVAAKGPSSCAARGRTCHVTGAGATATPAATSRGTITGTVQMTGEHLLACPVDLVDGTKRVTSGTLSNGKYELSALPGRYSVSFERCLGCDPGLVGIDVVAGGAATVNLDCGK